MRQREFLKLLGAGVLGLGAAPMGRGGEPAPDAKGKRRTKNFTWVTLDEETNKDHWARLFAKIRAAGIDGILPEIWNGRHAYFGSTRLPVKEERLEMMLPLARSEGLEVHAWMWSMPCLVEDILKKHPDWYNVNAKGESAADKPAYVPYYRFLDPARPEVREFVQGTVKELAAYSDLQGVHLDYIRHPDAILPKGLWGRYKLVQDRVYPEFDYGYTDYSREQFRKARGVDPMKIQDPESDREWMQYRLDAVVDLVNLYLVPAAHAGGKAISAAVFPGPTLARRMVRQDWGRFQLDLFFPMLYSNFYEAGPEWVAEQTREGVAAVKSPLMSGLFVPGTEDNGLSALLGAALSSGAAGVCLFDLQSMDEGKWASFSRAVGVS